MRGDNPASFICPVKEAVQRLGAGRPVNDVRLLADYVTAVVEGGVDRTAGPLVRAPLVRF